MACLYLFEAHWDTLHVLWANTGKNFPEAVDLINFVRAKVKNFHEVKTDQEKQTKEFGLPADVVPIHRTVFGASIYKQDGPRIQDYPSCCYQNISGPLMAKTLEIGCTHVIKGQRADDSFKSTSQNGTVYGGVTFVQPIEAWTKQQVLEYVQTKLGSLPKQYALDHSSMDCFDCTAFSSHSIDRAKYMREHHPNLFRIYLEKVKTVKSAVDQNMEAMNQICSLSINDKSD